LSLPVSIENSSFNSTNKGIHRVYEGFRLSHGKSSLESISSTFLQAFFIRKSFWQLFSSYVLAKKSTFTQKTLMKLTPDVNFETFDHFIVNNSFSVTNYFLKLTGA